MLSLLDTELADDTTRDPLEQFMSYIDLVAKEITNPEQPTSCLLGNFMQELSISHPQLRQQGHDILIDWTTAIEATLDRAVIAYNISKMVDTWLLAEMFIAVYEGALILAKTKQEDSVIPALFEQYKQYVKHIIN